MFVNALLADDLVALLERCKAGLREGGIVVIKENVCRTGFIVDPVSLATKHPHHQ